MTISVLAVAPGAGLVGAASASRSLAVGADVPAVLPGTGAVVTQAWTNPHLRGPVLAALADRGGVHLAELVGRLDPEPALRQVAAVDAAGVADVWTGGSCTPYAGHRSGPGWVVAGNFLAGPGVVTAAADVLGARLPEAADAGGLADLLVAALEAAQAEGGDRRGQQSAAVLVGAAPDRAASGPPPYLVVDLRSDDHPHPLVELRRLLLLRAGVSPRTE